MSYALQRLLIAVVVAVVAVNACPRTTPVKCPTVEYVPDFDVGKYEGRWYEIERSPQVFQPNGACVTAQYSLEASTDFPGYPITVTNRQLNEETGQYESITGGVKQADDADGRGKLKVIFPRAQESDYWVLSTDYTSYAIVYSCRVLADASVYENAWILGRSSQLTKDTKRAVETAFQGSGISRDILTKTRQDSTCNYDNVRLRFAGRR